MKKPDTETESDEEMSEQDFAKSSSSHNELAADSREATVVEALDPHRVE